MNDFEKTRRLSDIPETVAKTRLVRPSETANEERRTPDLNNTGMVPKTRLFGRPASEAPEHSNSSQNDRLVTGWLVIIRGPGRGQFSPIYDGMNSVGRGEDQSTSLNFGDESISRSEHAFITYDYVDRKFYLTHGGKANIVRLNGKPVLQPVEIVNGDIIDIGATSCRMMQFCGPDFDWQEQI